MCMPFSSESYELLRRTEGTDEWARRLETKYGIVQPMAPDDVLDTPSACSMATTAGMRRDDQ